jgi:hypothetical protein
MGIGSKYKQPTVVREHSLCVGPLGNFALSRWGLGALSDSALEFCISLDLSLPGNQSKLTNNDGYIEVLYQVMNLE